MKGCLHTYLTDTSQTLPLVYEEPTGFILLPPYFNAQTGVGCTPCDQKLLLTTGGERTWKDLLSDSLIFGMTIKTQRFLSLVRITTLGLRDSESAFKNEDCFIGKIKF